MKPAYIYKATLIRVIDGDTYVLDVDLGFKVHSHITVRVRGVDTPELNTPEGEFARGYVEGILKERNLLVQSYKDVQSFARWVCDVYLIPATVGEPINIAELLIEKGMQKEGYYWTKKIGSLDN